VATLTPSPGQPLVSTVGAPGNKMSSAQQEHAEKLLTQRGVVD
jgi:hypothetical protein